jgi:AcrR family transcriptional regulator
VLNKPQGSEPRRGRGRPKGNPDTKGAIVAAAGARFRADGYAATTLRSIARDVGVDPALINYHFGSKQGLFAAAMILEFSPSAVLEGVLSTAGRPGSPPTAAVLLGAFLDAWDDEKRAAALAVLLREAVANEEIRRPMREYLEGEIVGRLAGHLGGREARQRAAPVAAVMAGLVFARYLIGIEPLASMPRAEVIRFLGPTLAAALGEPVPVRRSPRP